MLQVSIQPQNTQLCVINNVRAAVMMTEEVILMTVIGSGSMDLCRLTQCPPLFTVTMLAALNGLKVFFPLRLRHELMSSDMTACNTSRASSQLGLISDTSLCHTYICPLNHLKKNNFIAIKLKISKENYTLILIKVFVHSCIYRSKAFILFYSRIYSECLDFSQ